MSEPIPGAVAETWRRLHPLTLLFDVAGALRALVLPVILAVFFSRARGELATWIGWAVAATAISALYAVTRFLSLRYALRSDAIVVHSGVLFREARTIPLPRVQNVDVQSGLVQRWFGLVKVKIETAGSSEAEVELSYVGREEADSLRRALFGGHATAVVGAPAGVERSARLRDLLLAGVTENRVGVILAAAYGIYELYEDVAEAVRDPLTRATERVLGTGPMATVVAVCLGVALLVVAGWVLSIAYTVFRYHGFTIRGLPGELRLAHGLLTRFETVVKRGRVQHVCVESNPLRRRFGVRSVRAELAGSVQAGEAEGAVMLFPLLAEAEAASLVRVVFEDLELSDLILRPVHPLALRRGFLRYFAAGLVGTVIACWPLGWTGLLFLAPVVLLAAFAARDRYRALGYAQAGSFFVARGGVWTRRLWVVPVDKVQTVAARQSPLQRLYGLATLTIETAGGSALHLVEVVDLSLDEAHRLFEDLSLAAAGR